MQTFIPSIRTLNMSLNDEKKKQQYLIYAVCVKDANFIPNIRTLNMSLNKKVIKHKQYFIYAVCVKDAKVYTKYIWMLHLLESFNEFQYVCTYKLLEDNNALFNY